MTFQKRGFTLVELLAVIAILGLVAVIIIPSVIKTIEKSRMESVVNSARGLMRSIEIKQKDNMFEQGLKEIEISYDNGVESSSIPGISLDYHGKQPKNGGIVISKDGKITFAFHDGDYCVEKGYLNDKITISKIPEENCYLVKGITFIKTFGGTSSQLFSNIINVKDGYVAVGSSWSNDGDLTDLNGGASDSFIVKYDLNGNVIWKQSYGGTSFEGYSDVTEVNDGYIAVGSSSSINGPLTGLNKGSTDATIVKYDLNGNLVWNKNFGGSSGEGFTKIITLSDGVLVLGSGSSNNGDLLGLNKGGNDIIIAKYDFNGNVIWNKNFGGSDYDSSNSFTLVNDGFVVVGSSSSINGDLTGLNKGGVDATIIKYDFNGNVIWNKNFGGSDTDYFHDVGIVDDGYIAVGDSRSSNGDMTGLKKGERDAIIVKYDFSGNVLWKKNYGEDGQESFFAISISNNEIVVAGEGSSEEGQVGQDNKGSYDAIIVKYDLNGNVLWNKNFGGSDTDKFNGIKIVDDGIVAVGETSSQDCHIAGLNKGWGGDAFILKVNRDGNIKLECKLKHSGGG
ncbi:MAG: prepilin-type N-terminal cleavage/methylation domain-containing protein [Bacilli bacterium]|nr:prepilin-type N-terminal cleavage/methylation domain-containing protein [Bacilli bacterium]MDD4608448.1 prepilin-type N-terminal cleavage/methylation domain-containing protein [Bacilli bacterium]